MGLPFFYFPICLGRREILRKVGCDIEEILKIFKNRLAAHLVLSIVAFIKVEFTVVYSTGCSGATGLFALAFSSNVICRCEWYGS